MPASATLRIRPNAVPLASVLPDGTVTAIVDLPGPSSSVEHASVQDCLDWLDAYRKAVLEAAVRADKWDAQDAQDPRMAIPPAVFGPLLEAVTTADPYAFDVAARMDGAA